MTRIIARRGRPLLIAAGVGVIAATLLVASPASAHVRFDGDSGTAAVGTTATLVFRVPTESDTASTVGLTVTFPEDEPFSSVQPEAKPGWDAQVRTLPLPAPVTDSTGAQITSYVQSVTWTATAGGIPPELYDTFTVRAGAVPDADAIPIPSLQTYSDGSTVDWAEIAQAGATPPHPAPVLEIVPATDAGQAPSDGPTASIESNGGGAAGSGPALGLGIAGLAAGLLGLVLGIVALLRTRRPAVDRS